MAVACGLGCYQGDDRGPDPNGGTSRIQFGIDDSGNLVGAYSDDSVRVDGSQRARAHPACVGDDARYSCVAKNPMEADTPILGALVPPIDFTVTMGDGGPRIKGRAFPSYEIWQYNPDGTADLLFNYDGRMNPFGPYGLFFGIDVPNVP